MGILDILKRGKSVSKPPEAKAEFPELPAEHLPPLPESSLPPLPGAESGGLPMPPGMGPLDEKGPELPNIPRPEGIPKPPELPEMPDMPSDEGLGLPELPEMPPMQEAEVKTVIPKIPKVPEAPKPEVKKAPKMPEAPRMPKVPTLPKVEQLPRYEPEAEAMPEFPSAPEAEYVPERVPPLEGIGEVPDFKAPPRVQKAAPSRSMFETPQRTKEEVRTAPQRRVLSGPLFVKVTSFKDIMLHIEDILARFKEEDDVFFRMTDIKNTQDKRYENFRLSLEDVQRKLLFIDKSLFERR
ncbi:TPA: hypothetical protein HA265_05885 [Candidatus Woesearchaeota archaeon]|nr:hypothetical protein [Candidatus Woesearchaeota archaeon]